MGDPTLLYISNNRRPAPVQPRQPPEYRPAQYQPQYATQQQTQAIYASAQQPRLPPKPSQPIFSPAEDPRLGPGLQSQLIQQQLYDEEVSLARSNFKTGPVQFNPAPVQESQPRPQPQARSGGGGILDQLARDYALPQGGAAPLHDISFGYY
jgi:hypothetical protein